MTSTEATTALFNAKGGKFLFLPPDFTGTAPEGYYAFTSPTFGVSFGTRGCRAFVDAQQRPLDRAKTDRLHLPPNIPAKQFWSLVLYDTQTRSMLQTDQQFPSISSQKKGVAVNPDTSVDVYFGPTPPPGKESNWVVIGLYDWPKKATRRRATTPRISKSESRRRQWRSAGLAHRPP